MSAYDNSAMARQPLQLVQSAPQPVHEELLDLILDQLATRVADRIAAQLDPTKGTAADQWLDSSGAAEYLGISRHSVRRLAAEGSLPTEQDGPNCKLYFRRSHLDSWRRGSTRPARLRSAA